MTTDQLIIELFVNHWLFTTICFPPLTFAYAWVTDSTAWWVCSLLWMLVFAGGIKVRWRSNED